MRPRRIGKCSSPRDSTSIKPTPRRVSFTDTTVNLGEFIVKNESNFTAGLEHGQEQLLRMTRETMACSAQGECAPGRRAGHPDGWSLRGKRPATGHGQALQMVAAHRCSTPDPRSIFAIRNAIGSHRVESRYRRSRRGPARPLLCCRPWTGLSTPSIRTSGRSRHRYE